MSTDRNLFEGRNISEEELLAELLSSYFPHEENVRVAKNTVCKFGSVYRALCASERELMRVDGMTESAAFFLTMQFQAFQRIRNEEETVSEDPLYRFSQFAVNLTGGRNTEAIYLALLDGDGRLCDCRLVAEGDAVQVNVDMRNIFRTVTDCPQAKSAVLIHNHPSGEPTPSLEDVASTEAVKKGLATLGIKLKDHIVAGQGKAFSFSAGGLQEQKMKGVRALWKDREMLAADGMPFFPEMEDDAK